MAMERQERVAKNSTISAKTKFECLQHIRVDQWSPEQISGMMKLKGVKVSHTTIYKWVAEDKVAGGTLFGTLAPQRKQTQNQPLQRCIGPQHSRPNLHKRTTGRGRRQALRRLGNGPDNRSERDTRQFGYLLERSTGYVIIHRLKHGKRPRNWLLPSEGC